MVMEILMVCFMGVMIFSMLAVDTHLCKIREALKDIKTLMELKKKYTEGEE